MDPVTLSMRLRLPLNPGYDGASELLWSFKAQRDARNNQQGLTLRLAKMVNYTLVGVPTGAALAKLVQYDVLGVPTGAVVAKVVNYIILGEGNPWKFGGPPKALLNFMLRHDNDPGLAGDTQTPSIDLRAFMARNQQLAIASQPVVLGGSPMATRRHQHEDTSAQDQATWNQIMRRPPPPAARKKGSRTIIVG